MRQLSLGHLVVSSKLEFEGQAAKVFGTPSSYLGVCSLWEASDEPCHINYTQYSAKPWC